jgi:ATP-dependent Clp protease ATP-binding subunit ClpB
MRFDKFTLKVQEALQEAQTLANKYRHQAIDTEHLLVALLAQQEGIIGETLKKLGIDPKGIDDEIKKHLEKLPKVEGSGAGQAYLTPELNKVLDNALLEAARLKDEYVSAEHVLLTIVESKEGTAGKILRAKGITKDNIFKVLVEIRGSQRITDPNPEEKYQATLCPRFQRSCQKGFIRSCHRAG